MHMMSVFQASTQLINPRCLCTALQENHISVTLGFKLASLHRCSSQHHHWLHQDFLTPGPARIFCFMHKPLTTPTKAYQAIKSNATFSCTTIALPSGGGAFRRFSDLRHRKDLRRKQGVKPVFNLMSLRNSHSSRACQGKILPASIEKESCLDLSECI